MHVGVPEDPYIPRSQLETVDVELHAGGHVLAAVNTVLDPDQESEAEQLAREIARKLASGELGSTKRTSTAADVKSLSTVRMASTRRSL